MPSRQLLIINTENGEGAGSPSDASPPPLCPLGKRQQVYDQLADFNMAPDVEDGEFLYGPGMSVQAPPSSDSIMQMIVTLTDEDIAWPVLERMCAACGWKLMDTESGRVLSFG